MSVREKPFTSIHRLSDFIKLLHRRVESTVIIVFAWHDLTRVDT
ncbi:MULTISPECIES: hypothetical protein [unclassified Burkholderia]|nr:MULTISPECIES: hypothetical protein [unclassified Burkholderia]MDN7491420.1 hypothetical protein [Burkholderia sp. AU45274]